MVCIDCAKFPKVESAVKTFSIGSYVYSSVLMQSQPGNWPFLISNQSDIWLGLGWHFNLQY